MTDLRTAAQQALEAGQVPLRELLASVPADTRLVIDDADGKGTRFIPVGRLCQEAAAALAEPVQEPVGQLLEQAFGRGQVMWFNKPADGAMLYAAPPQRKPLTDEEIEKLPWGPHEGNPMTFAEGLRDFARAVERAHGIKESV